MRSVVMRHLGSRLFAADAVNVRTTAERRRTSVASIRCGRRRSVVAGASTSSRLLAHLPTEAREEVARVVELAERASSRWTIDRSPFLPPPLVAAALEALSPLDFGAVAWGGFPGAERQRVVVGRPEMFSVSQDEEENTSSDDIQEVNIQQPSREQEEDFFSPPPNRRKSKKGAGTTSSSRATRKNLDLSDPEVGGVSPISITGNFVFEQATHRDFLGAVLGSAGLDRRVVGDVLLKGERGAVALVSPEVVEALRISLTRVRSVPVVVTGPDEGALDELKALTSPSAAAPFGTPVRSVEASLRVDAVASAGFRSPRSAAASAARSGDLKLNYREVKPSSTVAAGDLFSWRGKGRVKVLGVEETKRGKFAVEMERFAR